MKGKELFRTFVFAISSILWRNKNSKIIYYHDIFSGKRYTKMGTPLNLFKKHIEIALKTGYSITDRICKPTRELSIMLDDGFRGIWECRNYFYQNNIHPTIFIAKDLVGKEGYLNESEIKELDLHGWIFQSHTVSHTNMTCYNQEDLNKQLSESKKYLEKLLHHPITEVCAPQGYFSDTVLECALKNGYTLFYSSIPGDYDEFVLGYSFLKTRNLCQFLTPFQFKLMLLGGYKLLQSRYLEKGYLISTD